MRSRKLLRIAVFLLGGLLSLCMLGLGLSALSNLFLPKGPERPDQLGALDKARLAEALHLRTALGDRVWPGFGQLDIPVILWNRQYAFLAGLAERPEGWEIMPGEAFDGKPLFRKIESDPQNFAGQFLAQRDARRGGSSLPSDLIDYERQLEWEEGLAKYAEMEIWHQASLAPDYQPLPEMAADADFKEYRAFGQRWNQEIGQLRRQARQEGENRFYLTGMAQATLLDRLHPDWKESALGKDAFLEDLLRQALNR